MYREAVSVKNAVFREYGVHKEALELSRRYWRKVGKRNGGRKLKTLRSHRVGK